MKCPHCDGTGIDPASEHYRCSLCKGRRNINPAPCKHPNCGEPLIFVLLPRAEGAESGRWHPCDANSYQEWDPKEHDGKTIVVPRPARSNQMTGRIVRLSRKMSKPVWGFTSHFVTCPEAKTFKKR